MDERKSLCALSERVGILPHYTGLDGNKHPASDETREYLLHAMGFDASSEAGAQESLLALDRAVRDCLLPPVRVVEYDALQPPTLSFGTAAPSDQPAAWELVWLDESGWERRFTGRGKHPDSHGRITLGLPFSPSPGYHRIRISLPDAEGAVAEQLLIVAPAACCDAFWRMSDRRTYGISLNLYSVAGERDWGAGDFGDARVVAEAAAAEGADFIGLNPIHAVTNTGDDICPYMPLSRIFHNPLYLDVHVVPELIKTPELRARLASPEFLGELERLRSLSHVDYERVIALKLAALRELYSAFRTLHEHTDTERGRAYRTFLHNGGPPLDHHAVFMALAEHFHTTQWRHWPREFQSASNPAVALFASRHRQEIGFHLYVQFELDRQLESLAALTRAGRMQIGLYLDLALGSSEAGSDAWTNPELFVPGVRVGAPPDPYSATGQTWGFPPLHPLRLRESKYDYWIRVLRAQMAHAGMVRIDHVMGLFRQYWVPEGQTAEAGAYVRFPADDLLGILALESQRHGVIVIGEDLGTVPPEVPEAMRRRRMLSSKVVWFEREWDGRFKPAGPYPERALTTVTTHDLPPLNGLWTKRDLDIRREIGLITDDEASVLADRERRDELAALVQRLREEKLLEESDGPTFEELCTAVHAFAGRTRSVLFGVYLDDVAGEIEPVNIPGVRLSQYRSWSRRMRRTVESLVADPGVLRVLDEIRRARESR